MSSTEKGGSKDGAAPKSFASLPMTVGGILVTAEDAQLVIDSIDEGHKRVAAQMSWWGKVWAEAVREAAQADAHYRHWRAKIYHELEEDKATKGLPEHKIKAHIEARKEFLQYKYSIANADANVITAKTQFDSFSEKARQIQSMGAKAREELGVQKRDTTRARPNGARVETGVGETSPVVEDETDLEVEPSDVSADKIEKAKERMRELNSRGKKNP
jgi:hypothetical protein